MHTKPIQNLSAAARKHPNAELADYKKRLEQAEARTEQAESRTETAKSRTEAAEMRTEKAETRTELAKNRTEHAEDRIEQAETRTEQAVSRSEQAEANLQRVIHRQGDSSDKIDRSLIKELLVIPEENSPLNTLTSRQRNILKFIAEGQNTKQIAEILKLSPKTVEYHRMKLMKRLGIHDIPGLVRLALQTGLLPPEV